ncbi:hypothetical protein A2U01_0084881, partial [Trifolium medium]|nr:hypothetical protein [Trifolium medium]
YSAAAARVASGFVLCLCVTVCIVAVMLCSETRWLKTFGLFLIWYGFKIPKGYGSVNPQGSGY